MTLPRLLVTGANGFIGRFCLPILAGFEVHAVSRQLHSGQGAIWHQADILEEAQRNSLLASIRPSHLLHLAWVTTHGSYWMSTENLQWVESSLALLRAFHEHGGRRTVIAGTCAEYDWKFGLCSEWTTPCNPRTLYGTCKNSLRNICDSFAALVGHSLAWGRVFFVYGPGEKPERLVPSVIQSLLAGAPAHCTAGTQRRDFLYVADAADAFVSLLRRDDVVGPVNIGSGEAIPIADVVNCVARQIGSPGLLRLGALPMSQDDPPLLVADSGRLAREVGWSPKFTLDGGLAATIDWWKVKPGVKRLSAN
jgi:nucleoside-diphosphate-sugar epimerase